MNPKKDQISLTLPPTPKELQVMRHTLENGNAAIASKGTDNFALWSHLVESGYMVKRHCPMAWGCYQFEVTEFGREAIAERDI